MPFGEDVFAGVGGRTGDTGQKYSSSTDDIRQKFTGYQKDSETSLDFAEARMYENRFGRFTAVDPLLASGRSVDPKTFNRYVYVGNSPLVMTDPSGMVGDYFNRQGEWLGTDGKKDFKTYFATEVYREGKVSYLDPRSIVPTTTEAVMRAQVSAVPLTPGNEFGAINTLATSVSNTVDEAGSGAAKGGANFCINTWNTVSNPLGPNGALIGVPSPWAITPYTYNTPTERNFGTATETGLILAPAAAGGPFRTPTRLGPSVEHPTTVLQGLTNRASADLAASPGLYGTVLSPAELAAGQRAPYLANMFHGKAMERLTARYVGQSPETTQMFRYKGGPGSPDFVGIGPAKGMNFDITTARQITAHLARPGYGKDLQICTYERPGAFSVFKYYDEKN